MRIFLSLVFVFMVSIGFGQYAEPTMLDLKTIGGDGSDMLTGHVTKTTDGGFIVSISSDSHAGTGNIDSFASCIASAGDIFTFLKYSADAVPEWSKCYKYDGDSAFLFLFPNSGDAVVLGGIFGTTGSGYLISKHDAFGNIVWQKEYGKGLSPTLRDMIMTKDGGYLMLGESFYTDSDVAIHHGSWTDADIWLLKLDSNGNKMWSKIIGGTGYETPGSIIETAWGDYFLTGGTTSNDYDCTGNHGGGGDVYIARLDYNGNIIWHRDLGGTGTDGAGTAFIDNEGSITIAGTSNSTDGDNTHPTTFGGGIWVVKIDSGGSTLWNNSFGNNYCYATGVCKAVDGSIWISAVSSHAGLYLDDSYGHDDIWLVHANSADGSFLQGKVLGSDLDDRGVAIFPMLNGNIAAWGVFSAKNNSFSLSNYYGYMDAVMIEVSPFTASTTKVSLSQLRVFPNPAKKQLYVNFSTKCDRTITVYSLAGRVMLSKELANRSSEISVADWPKGIYKIEITEQSAKMTTTISVE